MAGMKKMNDLAEPTKVEHLKKRKKKKLKLSCDKNMSIDLLVCKSIIVTKHKKRLSF